jgi:hypothetical protein
MPFTLGRALAGLSLIGGLSVAAPGPIVAATKTSPVAARVQSAAVGATSHYLVAWGDDTVGQTEVPDGISDIAAISAGYNHSLGRRSGGGVVAWGANGSGQTDIPAGLSGVSAVAAGYGFSLALISTGTVVAWGDPSYGVTAVPGGLAGVTAIAAGYNHALALKSDRTVVAWGRNTDGEATVPAGLTNVSAVAAGRNFSLALKDDGTVVGWGHGSHGETTVAGLTDIVAISAGADHALALRSDHTVVAWGDNSYGQTSVPAGLSDVTAISAGGDHSLALRSDGTVGAWGDNYYGQAAVPGGLWYAVAVAAGATFSVALTRPPTLELTGLSSPRVGGTAGMLTVTAKDSTGATAAGYRGTVAFSSTDPRAILPAAYTFTAGDAGVGTFSVTLKTAGTQTLTVTDTANSLVAGSQSIVVVYRSTTYRAITPARVLDTRKSNSTWTNIGLVGPFRAGVVRTFQVADARYVGGGSAVAVPAVATAVTGNLTVTYQTAGGLVALGPTMTAAGEVTTLHFARGENRANNVTVGLAPDGTLQAVFRAWPEYATTELIFDVTGYFLPDAAGATFHALTPGRVLDSRKSATSWTNIGLTGKFASGKVRTLTVAGARGLGWDAPQVPPGATAVTGNVTVTYSTSDGYVAVAPTISGVPKTSTVNTKKGKNTANGVTVALNAGRLQVIWMGTSGSTADVIFDVTGYFTPDQSGLSFYPVAPYRALDSSSGRGLPGVFSNGTVQLLTVGGAGGEGGVPIDAAGIAGNLTLIHLSSNGYALAAPAIPGTPTSSTVNSTAYVTVANGLNVALDAGGELALVWMGTGGSTAHLQLDVYGYWKAPD